MVSKVSLIKSEPAPSDRAGLLAALQAAADTKAVLVKATAAVDRLRSQVRELDTKIKAASTKIAEARTEHSHALANAAADDAPAPPSGVKAARAALAELEDEREALKAALDDLKAQIPDTELAVKQAEAAVDNEIARLLQPIALEFIANMRRLAGELAQVRSNLFALLDSDHIAPDDYDFRVKRQRVTDLVRAEFEAGQGEPRAAAATDWKALREQLRRDPNAPLPAI